MAPSFCVLVGSYYSETIVSELAEEPAMASAVVSTQIQLAARPVGWPTSADFRTVRVEFPELAAGQVRVANDFVSVDPYMRGRMNDVKSYSPPYALDETMTGGAVGRVVASASPAVAIGDVVVHQYGWRDLVQADAAGFRVVPELPGVPLSAYLGVLGRTALTAYVGLRDIGSEGGHAEAPEVGGERHTGKFGDHPEPCGIRLDKVAPAVLVHDDVCLLY